MKNSNVPNKALIFSTKNYAQIDGKCATSSDSCEVQALSLGVNDATDISAKIEYNKGHKSIVHSEEMPLHRVLDLAIMICKAYTFCKENAYGTPMKDALELQGAKSPLEVCTNSKEDFERFVATLAIEDERLGERFRVLAATLEKTGY